MNTPNTTEKKAVASFVTGMRAASFVEDLATAGIVTGVETRQPKWTNKRLPPPRIEVWVLVADFEGASFVLSEFRKEGGAR